MFQFEIELEELHVFQTLVSDIENAHRVIFKSKLKQNKIISEPDYKMIYDASWKLVRNIPSRIKNNFVISHLARGLDIENYVKEDNHNFEFNIDIHNQFPPIIECIYSKFIFSFICRKISHFLLILKNEMDDEDLFDLDME